MIGYHFGEGEEAGVKPGLGTDLEPGFGGGGECIWGSTG